MLGSKRLPRVVCESFPRGPDAASPRRAAYPAVPPPAAEEAGEVMPLPQCAASPFATALAGKHLPCSSSLSSVFGDIAQKRCLRLVSAAEEVPA